MMVRVDTEAMYLDKFATGSEADIRQYFGIRSDEEFHLQKTKVEGGMGTYRTSVLFFHFIEKTQGRVIGSCAYHQWYPQHRRSEIGYAITDDLDKNRGYMREAMPHIIAFGFHDMQLNRIEAFTSRENTASQKLLLRAGFRQEAILRQHYSEDGTLTDSLVFALLREEFDANQS